MPCAYRHFLPGYLWHITHRCVHQDFLLKFAKDRNNWIYWLYQARKRYDLCVLNYMVTCNHIHLLVKAGANDAIAKSMQLIAGRTAQNYNRRKRRKGAYWAGRYHATAVSLDAHFWQCLVYIDLNMVRAGRVQHPAHWQHCGYHEIYHSRQRYRIIDIPSLVAYSGAADLAQFTHWHQNRVDKALSGDDARQRDARWTEALAVGNKRFVEHIQYRLGVKAGARKCEAVQHSYLLREAPATYHTAGY